MKQIVLKAPTRALHVISRYYLSTEAFNLQNQMTILSCVFFEQWHDSTVLRHVEEPFHCSGRSTNVPIKVKFGVRPVQEQPIDLYVQS